MLKVITQDGEAKYEVSNYEILSAINKNPMSKDKIYYISTPDVGGKHLAVYSSVERAREVFEEMVEVERDHPDSFYIMPSEEMY